MQEKGAVQLYIPAGAHKNAHISQQNQAQFNRLPRL